MVLAPSAARAEASTDFDTLTWTGWSAAVAPDVRVDLSSSLALQISLEIGSSDEFLQIRRIDQRRAHRLLGGLSKFCDRMCARQPLSR